MLFPSLCRQYSCRQGWLTVPALRMAFREYQHSVSDLSRASCQWSPLLSLPLRFPQPFTFSLKWEQWHAAAFPQQQQLKPAVLQQGTVMRCWRDVCSRGEGWVERSDAFWSEVDSSIVWGAACWTADVPFPQCKSRFSPSALLVGAYSFPQTSLPFQNIPFTSWVGKPWPPGLQPGVKWAALIPGPGAALPRGKLLCLLSAGPGCCQQLPWLWRQLDLCKLCLRPLLCPHLQVLVYSCLRVTLSDDA